MKEGDLVKILDRETKQIYAYGILTDEKNYIMNDEPYSEVWLFRYAPHFGDMPARKTVFRNEDIVHIKTFEDW